MYIGTLDTYKENTYKYYHCSYYTAWYIHEVSTVFTYIPLCMIGTRTIWCVPRVWCTGRVQ